MSRVQVVLRQFNQVIPPPSFKYNLLKIDNLMKTMPIPHPLEQQVFVGRDFYDLRLIQRKALLMGDYKKIVDKDALLIKGKSLVETEKFVYSKVLGKFDKAEQIVWS